MVTFTVTDAAGESAQRRRRVAIGKNKGKEIVLKRKKKKSLICALHLKITQTVNYIFSYA